MGAEIYRSEELVKGYQLMEHLLSRIKDRRGSKLAEEIAAATLEAYYYAPDKS